MKVDGKVLRTIWHDDETDTVHIVDQRRLPHRIAIEKIDSVAGMVRALRESHLIGEEARYAAGAYGVFLAAKTAPRSEFRASIDRGAAKMTSACAGSIGLARGIRAQLRAMKAGESRDEQVSIARSTANELAEECVRICNRIGEEGLTLISRLSRERSAQESVHVLLLGNGSGISSVENGTVSSTLIAAKEAGHRVHAWIPESRPRSEGARLLAWELGQHDVSLTLVTDSAVGSLMQNRHVDLTIGAATRVERDGSVVAQAGTYGHALAAADNQVPFYLAHSSHVIDWKAQFHDFRIDKSLGSSESVRFATGLLGSSSQSVLVAPANCRALDVECDRTPSHLITGHITDRGICGAEFVDLLNLYPERKPIVNA